MIFVLSLVLLAAISPMAKAAGSLEPSAPPGPVMKSLDEVEPRIPIRALDVPLTITQSGSYYLTQDLTLTHPDYNAITVDCNDVTIDLMGYNMIGPNTGTSYGIYIRNVRSNVEIRNGSVKNFSCGIYAQNCVCRNLRAVNVRAIANRSYGIYLSGGYNLVKNCTASSNGASASIVYGILAGSGAVVVNNVVCENGTSATSTVYGINAGNSSTVTGNMVQDNGMTASGSYVYGICAGSGCTVIGNSVCTNGYSSTTSGVYGVYAASTCVVSENAVYNNGYGNTGSVYGIFLYGDCLVDRNTAYGNGINISSCSTCYFGLNHAP
jgi:hypothetical protein